MQFRKEREQSMMETNVPLSMQPVPGFGGVVAVQ